MHKISIPLKTGREKDKEGERGAQLEKFLFNLRVEDRYNEPVTSIKKRKPTAETYQG